MLNHSRGGDNAMMDLFYTRPKLDYRISDEGNGHEHGPVRIQLL